MATLDMDEVEALECDIPWVEALLYEHNPRTRENSAHLFCRLSTEDSGCLRHIEFSHCQSYIWASIGRFFNSPQAQLCPTKNII